MFRPPCPDGVDIAYAQTGKKMNDFILKILILDEKLHRNFQ